MKVGVFDSGVGGLSVVDSLIKANLFKKIIYYGDTARVPYGTKDPNTIVRYSIEALEFFDNFNIDMMVVACNSASAHALEDLKKRANFPVIGVIEPGVMALNDANLNKNDEILIIGTRATISSNIYQNLLKDNGYTNINSIATSLFIPIVEEGIYDGPILEESFKYYFKDTKKPKAIILGCTHFPLIKNSLSKYFEGAKLIHSGDAIVNYLQEKKMVDLLKNSQKTKLTLFASENVGRVKDVASLWINR